MFSLHRQYTCERQHAIHWHRLVRDSKNVLLNIKCTACKVVYIYLFIYLFIFIFIFLIAQVMLITHDRCMIDEIKVIW